MTQVKITFLETRVVQDQHAGTDLETRYDAGETYGFDDARSAARWVRRGVAEFALKEDADLARDVVGDIIDERVQPAGVAEGLPLEEEATLAQQFGVKLVAAHQDLSYEQFVQLPAHERLAALRAAHEEFDKHWAERLEAPSLKDPPPPAAQPSRVVTAAGSDTDGDQQGDVKPAPATAETAKHPEAGAAPAHAVEADLENLTDEELRIRIKDRDGKAPAKNLDRAKLLELAKSAPSGDA